MPRLTEDGDLTVTGASGPWIQAQASLPGGIGCLTARAITRDRTAATVKPEPNQMSSGTVTFSHQARTQRLKVRIARKSADNSGQQDEPFSGTI